MLATAASLSEGQFNLVFNVFSFVTAAMGASTVFFLLVRSRVSPRHRLALTLSTLVVGIAAYHYFRITGSWQSAYELVDGSYVATNEPFNEGYRYADWLLTVPLLMAELVVVLALAKQAQRTLLIKLVSASALMVILGYPGEIASTDEPIKWISFVAGTVPFLYILWVLYAEMGGALERQSARVRRLFGALRTIILVTWSVYPLAFLVPYLNIDDSTAEVLRQVGYGIADVIAKPAFGLLLLAIAMVKSSEEGYDTDREAFDDDSVVKAA